ncbi:MAG: DUF2341 domain-containing protein [Candidatus Aenigmatarchaeota archaeon]
MRKVLILIFSFLFLFFLEPLTVSAGWLPGWQYRKSHVITNATGAGTNYQVRIIVKNATGTDSGDTVYIYNKTRSDFGDIRFTSSDGTTLLSYWIESLFTGINATFWVKVADNLNSSNATIYVYYGNSSATNISNGDSTFDFFDDFNDGVINTTKWETYSQSSTYVIISEGNGYGNITGLGNMDGYWGYWRTANNITINHAVRSKQYWARTDYINSAHRTGFGDTNADGMGTDCALQHHDIFYIYQPNPRIYSKKSGILTQLNDSSSINSWITYEVRWTSNRVEVLYGETSQGAITDPNNITNVNLRGGFWLWAGANYGTLYLYADWFAIRKYVYPEPSHGSWGIEELISYNLTSCSILNIPMVTYYLTANIINSSSSVCMNISANDIILDCQGYTIDGINSSSTYGIYVYRSSSTNTNITIKNCIVTDWYIGVYFFNSKNNTFTNINASSNGYGIDIEYYSDNSTLTNITANNNYYDGIRLWGSMNNSTLTNITANNNSGSGIITSSGNSSLSNIVANYNKYGVYISTNYVSVSNVIANNNKIRGITCHGDYNTLTNITANNNSEYGIYVYDYSNYNTFTNISLNNNNYGIYIVSSDYNTLTNITANNNSYGIYTSSITTITNCSLSNNTIGIASFSKSNISDCIFIRNQIGIDLHDPNKIKNNTFINNTISISISSSSGIFLRNNTIYSSHTSSERQQGLLVYSSYSSISDYRQDIDESNKINNLPIYYIDGINRTCPNNTVFTNGSSYSYMGFVGCRNITIKDSSPLEHILFAGTNDSTISGINISYSVYAMLLSMSYNNIIKDSIISNNANCGINITYSGNNKIYNNLFNNTNNLCFLPTIYANYWNTTRQSGKRIYSPGAEIGGNYWANPTGNGFSDTCNDTNADGFCDSPLILDPGQTGNNTDYLPLSKNYTWIEIWIESDKKTSSNKIVSHPSRNILAYGYAFYVNMSSSIPYSEKPINFSYNGMGLGSNSTNSSGFYTFNFLVNYEGAYTFKTSAMDGSIYGENSTDLLIFNSPRDAKFRISYQLGNTKEDDVYRIGNFNETINGLNISRILTPNQLSHAYVCTYDKTEYQEGLLLALIHSYAKDKLNSANFTASSLTTNYTLELNQKLDGSSPIIALTKGDCQFIDNKMYLVESQTIPSKAFSSFSFGLPIQNIFQIIVSYDKLKLEGNLSFSRGSHLLCIEKNGISDAFRPIVEVRKC